MLRTLAISTAALALLAGPVLAQQPGQKFAYIDSQKVIAEAPGAKQAQATFQKEMADYQAELTRMQDSIKAMIADYQNKEATLTAAAKQQREQVIQQKEAAYQKRVQELRQDANQKQQKLVKPIMDKIQTVIEQIRKEKNYVMIFDASSPGLIAADPSLDITDEVVARLKKMAATAGPTGPSK